MPISCLYNTYCLSVVTSYSFIWWSRIITRKLSRLVEIHWTSLTSCWECSLRVSTSFSATMLQQPPSTLIQSVASSSVVFGVIEKSTPHSIFSARRYAKARSLLSAGVRPSVCLSVTFVYCIQTAEDIVKPFSHSGSPIILVLWSRTQLQEERFSGSCKYSGVGLGNTCPVCRVVGPFRRDRETDDASHFSLSDYKIA